MKLTANVIGATGLVGKELVIQLLENGDFEKIKLFVRQDTKIAHPKLEQYIIDFNLPETWESHLNGDVLFSALGTTLKQAGSKSNQYKVDYTYNYNFAKTAKTNGISNYILVSSIGANKKSNIFYTRIKGELDDVVSKLDFKNLAIIRPSSLVGQRTKKRIMEIISIPIAQFLTYFIFRKYRPIKGETVAKAMINAVIQPDKNKSIWEGDEVFQLAKK